MVSLLTWVVTIPYEQDKVLLNHPLVTRGGGRLENSQLRDYCLMYSHVGSQHFD